MSLCPNKDAAEFATRPPNGESQDGPGFPKRQGKQMAQVILEYEVQELENSIRFHRAIQMQYDPLAHCQYWIRGLFIEKCLTKMSQLRTEHNSHNNRQFLQLALDTLNHHLKEIDVPDSSLHETTSAVLQGALADTKRWGPPSGKELYERKCLKLHEALWKSYGSRASSLGWCSVTHVFARVGPTHIFPYWVSEYVMKLIFGANFENDTLTENNGLIVHESMAVALANLWIVIVPSGASGSGRWKTRVIKKDLLDKLLSFYNQTWLTVDNWELKFQRSSGPSARYLYWHYATARIHASVGQPANFWSDLLGNDRWAAGDKYIRLDYVNAYLERRQEFELRRFDELGIYAIPGWPPADVFDVKIAAKLMSDVMDEQAHMIGSKGTSESPPAEPPNPQLCSACSEAELEDPGDDGDSEDPMIA